jgi:hypothetical protein
MALSDRHSSRRRDNEEASRICCAIMAVHGVVSEKRSSNLLRFAKWNAQFAQSRGRRSDHWRVFAHSASGGSTIALFRSRNASPREDLPNVLRANFTMCERENSLPRVRYSFAIGSAATACLPATLGPRRQSLST